MKTTLPLNHLMARTSTMQAILECRKLKRESHLNHFHLFCIYIFFDFNTIPSQTQMSRLMIGISKKKYYLSDMFNIVFILGLNFPRIWILTSFCKIQKALLLITPSMQCWFIRAIITVVIMWSSSIRKATENGANLMMMLFRAATRMKQLTTTLVEMSFLKKSLWSTLPMLTCLSSFGTVH